MSTMNYANDLHQSIFKNQEYDQHSFEPTYVRRAMLWMKLYEGCEYGIDMTLTFNLIKIFSI